MSTNRVVSLQQRYPDGQDANGQISEAAQSDWLAFRSVLMTRWDLTRDPLIALDHGFMLVETIETDSVAEHCFQHATRGTYFIHYEVKCLSKPTVWTASRVGRKAHPDEELNHDAESWW
jgi:hypothetical protein